VVIASGQTGLSRRGAERGRMKAVEFKTRFFCILLFLRRLLEPFEAE